jgi:hypothetical protein
MSWRDWQHRIEPCPSEKEGHEATGWQIKPEFRGAFKFKPLKKKKVKK